MSFAAFSPISWTLYSDYLTLPLKVTAHDGSLWIKFCFSMAETRRGSLKNMYRKKHYEALQAKSPRINIF
jgi:hypothetical protein